MKKLILITISIVSIFTGCSTPGKLIASTSTTVNHAMQAWAVFVVDGKATPAQEAAVRTLKAKYDAAEDAAVAANLALAKTGDKASWVIARDYLNSQKKNLINLVSTFTGKAI